MSAVSEKTNMFSRIEAFELFIVNKFVLLSQMELRLNNLEEMASTIFQYSLLCLDDIFTPGNLGFDLKIVRPYLINLAQSRNIKTKMKEGTGTSKISFSRTTLLPRQVHPC